MEHRNILSRGAVSGKMTLRLGLGPAYSLWESQYVSRTARGFGAHTNLTTHEGCVSSGSTAMSGVDDALPTVRHQHMGQDWGVQ